MSVSHRFKYFTRDRFASEDKGWLSTLRAQIYIGNGRHVI